MAYRPSLQVGFLIDYTWLDMLAAVPPKDFKTLLLGICKYQQSFGQAPYPADFKDESRAAFAAQIIKPRIDYRLCGSIRKSAATPPSEEPTPHLPPHLPPSGLKSSEAEVEKQVNLNTSESISVSEVKSTPTPSLPMAEPVTTPPAPQAKATEKIPYGVNGNVLLTPEQYRALTETHGVPEAYIEHFSDQIINKKYTIDHHFATILSWWEKDRHSPKWQNGSGYAAQTPSRRAYGFTGPSTFDVDEFFRDAVRKNFDDLFSDDNDPRSAPAG